MATSRCHIDERIDLRLVFLSTGVCKPSMDTHSSMALSTKRSPPRGVFDNYSLLGFDVLVAPCLKTSSTPSTMPPRQGLARTFHKLYGDGNASNQMAPNLHDVIRKVLQTQQAQNKIIEAYLKQIPSLARYNQAFRYFYLLHFNLHPLPPIRGTRQHSSKRHLFTILQARLLPSMAYPPPKQGMPMRLWATYPHSRN